MDAGVLPLAFYCRNAQLYLQKVAESRKLNLGEEELQHLKAFTSLVTSSIPTHPQFRGWKDIEEIQPVDLHAHITEAKQRIRELEDASHVDKPSSTTNGLKPGTGRPTSSKPVEPSRSAASKSVTSPRSKLNSPSKFSSEVMLKTGKSVRISEAVPKQRPQRWDITMTETYGVSKTAKPVSLIQRLKRGAVAPPAESKASPTRAPAGKVDVPRPSSAHGDHNPAPGEITSFRSIPRSRDSSRIRGGAGPSMPPSGRGSAALKALTSSSVKVRTLDEDCSQRLNSSNRGKRESADDGVNNRGGASSSSSARPASTSKLANHRASGGPWVRGILRNGSEDAVTDSCGAMVETDLEDEEELITWIPVPSRNEKSRVQRGSSNEGGCGEDSLESESRQRDHDRGEELRRHTPARGVREWKGGYVRGERSLDESMDATGTAAQGLRATEGSRRSVESRPASAPVRRTPARVVKVTSPSSGVQRSGVKENCERFRHQMRTLKEKAEDTRMREEEVESMAERLQRQLEGEIDLDGVDIWRNSTQVHEEDETEEFCEVHRVGRSIDQPGLERTSLESLDRTMTRLINGDYTDPSTPSAERVGLVN